VPDYHFYILDRENHLIRAAELVSCLSDDDALAAAAELVNDQHSVEVWERVRLVGKLAPKES
jgi:hypothetical protein